MCFFFLEIKVLKRLEKVRFWIFFFLNLHGKEFNSVVTTVHIKVFHGKQELRMEMVLELHGKQLNWAKP